MTDHLHGTRRRREVLQKIQVIAIGLSGSDRVAIFEVDETGRRLIPIASSAPDVSVEPIAIGAGLIGRSVEAGEIYERYFQPAAATSAERGLRASIPLRIDGFPIGAVAIFDREGGGATSAALDRKLIDIFARHAATALYCTGMYERIRSALDRNW